MGVAFVNSALSPVPEGSAPSVQFAATLHDFRAHNQTMHWIHLGPNSGTLFTLEAMKEAGMRTDPLICFTDMGATRESPMAEREAAARRKVAFFDKLLGHHNVYLGFDDEPSSKRFEGNRRIH